MRDAMKQKGLNYELMQEMYQKYREADLESIFITPFAKEFNNDYFISHANLILLKNIIDKASEKIADFGAIKLIPDSRITDDKIYYEDYLDANKLHPILVRKNTQVSNILFTIYKRARLENKIEDVRELFESFENTK